MAARVAAIHVFRPVGDKIVDGRDEPGHDGVTGVSMGKLIDAHGRSPAVTDLVNTFTQRGDLAHLALFLWASSSSLLAVYALKELGAVSRRFDDFVRALAHLNDHLRSRP